MRQSSIFGWGRIYLYLYLYLYVYLYPYPLCISGDYLTYSVVVWRWTFCRQKTKSRKHHLPRCLFLGHGVCSNQHNSAGVCVRTCLTNITWLPRPTVDRFAILLPQNAVGSFLATFQYDFRTISSCNFVFMFPSKNNAEWMPNAGTATDVQPCP